MCTLYCGTQAELENAALARDAEIATLTEQLTAAQAAQQQSAASEAAVQQQCEVLRAELAAARAEAAAAATAAATATSCTVHLNQQRTQHSVVSSSASAWYDQQVGPQKSKSKHFAPLC